MVNKVNFWLPGGSNGEVKEGEPPAATESAKNGKTPTPAAKTNEPTTAVEGKDKEGPCGLPSKCTIL